MRQELALARAELVGGGRQGGQGRRADRGRLGRLDGVAVRLLTGVWALDEAMDTAWAALIVTGVWALIGIGLYLAGRARLREVSPAGPDDRAVEGGQAMDDRPEQLRRDIEQTR